MRFIAVEVQLIVRPKRLLKCFAAQGRFPQPKPPVGLCFLRNLKNQGAEAGAAPSWSCGAASLKDFRSNSPLYNFNACPQAPGDMAED